MVHRLGFRPSAIILARKALAEQGSAEAQFKLGAVYYHGEGTLQNYKEAVKWYTTSAEQGNADGQFNLGLMYSNGEGTALHNRVASDVCYVMTNSEH